MRKIILRLIITVSAISFTVGCTHNVPTVLKAETLPAARVHEIDEAFASILNKHHINTAGVGIIKNGKLIWQNQYGLQSPGVPATASTLFNVASITKTVTTETILRLVAQGQLSLDEPMYQYWLDPDLKDEPLVEKLTPRMALTHTTGFMNWRFFSEDNKLKFVNAPGTTFGYSGEGIKYLARYTEEKLGMPFESLVKKTIFEPLGMKDVSISVNQENFQRIARPLDENGVFHGYYCYPNGYCRNKGEYSAAGDMVVTVADYARFLISAMHGEGLNQALQEKRDNIQVTSYEIDCSLSPQILCPKRLGYGLGWNITELENDTLIGHSGSDWSMVTLAYYYQKSNDGLIIFFNAPNKAGIAAMVDALELLDAKSPKLHEYRARLARANN